MSLERYLIGALIVLWTVVIGRQLYLAGYHTAEAELQSQWYQGAEGYCLAQDRPGAC